MFCYLQGLLGCPLFVLVREYLKHGILVIHRITERDGCAQIHGCVRHSIKFASFPRSICHDVPEGQCPNTLKFDYRRSPGKLAMAAALVSPTGSLS